MKENRPQVDNLYICEKCGHIMKFKPEEYIRCRKCNVDYVRKLREGEDMSEVYDADYFLRGKESGKSLYTDYRWLPDLTIPMVCTMVSYLGIKSGQTVLDFGCARGYTVRAFRELGYTAFGTDASKWVVDNCDPDVKEYVSHDLREVDWVIAKDVLEHVNYLPTCIQNLFESARVGIFVVVPLSIGSGYKYVVPEYEEDITHIHRKTLAEWVGLFIRKDWTVTASYRVPGIKDNYYKDGWEKGNGFITVRRENL